MKQWPYELPRLSKTEILKCISDADWQKFRLSLKGLSTEKKLDKLEQYLTGDDSDALHASYEVNVQVVNYINALKRGGQLDKDGRVVK